jgi:hypothetical protein
MCICISFLIYITEFVKKLIAEPLKYLHLSE